MGRGLRRAAAGLAVAVVLGGPPVAGALGEDGGGTPETAAGRSYDAGQARARTAERMKAGGIVDLPVEFRVVNRNRSALACNTDGRTYTVRGHLTAPAGLLDRPGPGRPPVTVYQHGFEAAEWYWRVDVPGYHHSEEMARRGQISLTFDRVGYGASDRPDGRQLCLGGAADMTHQIVGLLRSGAYTVKGRATAPRFGKVALAGHDRGAQIAQIAAYSFHDVDGLVLTGWSDGGLTDEDDARFFAALTSCMQGGVPAVAPDDPVGYVHLDPGPREFAQGNFADTDPRVLDVALARQSRHSCGEQAAQLEGVLVDTRRLDRIRVPVALVLGAEDRRVGGGSAHRARFTGTADTALLTVRGSGHFLALERGARQIHDFLADWLEQKGLTP
ncbi:alpha/beta hydrolase [Streptomyces sp. NK15101]|uniref:alpha/beta hydrolase n=1 Tax=Streptomyces sp. NK15101 TaxID=2873261 RepID=UPI001CEC6D89|nr:alpha/beta hydrolase [Streptomyces sp. NK15101]